MDEETFFLVPKSQMPGNLSCEENSHKKHVGGGSPVNIVSGLEVPEHTIQYRNLALNERAKESLKSNIPPEITLKLFNFLQGLYTKSIPSSMDANETITQKNEENKQANNNEVYIQTLPPAAKRLAPGFIDYIENNANIKIEPTGFISQHGVSKNIHLVDLLRTVLINKAPVTPEINQVIQTFINHAPESFIKNKALKVEDDDDDQFWEGLN